MTSIPEPLQPRQARRPTRGARPPFWAPFPRYRDLSFHPYFRGGISRRLWRYYSHRLTPASRWLFLITIFFASYGSTSLELQAFVPFSYLFMLWSAAQIMAAFVRPRVVLKARFADRVCAGETVPIEFEITSRSRLRTDLTILPHSLPASTNPEPPTGCTLVSIAPGETQRTRLNLRCEQRGLCTWPGFRVETDYPFGMLRSSRICAVKCAILVYPRFTRLARFAIPSGRRYQPGGVALTSTQGDSFEFVGNREYRQGDNIRNMDWRATARLQIPILREYREEYFLRVAVVLDTFVAKNAPEEEHENFERAISVCAAIGDYMARSDYIVDIFAAGPSLYHLTAGMNVAYLDQILEILASVESRPVEPFETLEPEIMGMLGQITTVICIFTDWSDSRRAFVERLMSEGEGVKVVVVRDTPCTLDPSDADLPDPIPVLTGDQVDHGIEEI